MNMLASIDGILSSGIPNDILTKSEKADASIDISPDYALEGLNLKSDIPLEKIIAAVKNFRDGTRRPEVDRPRMSILLSGIPGGGKTAFARYLAKEVGAKLRSCRASDLLSKWIGESEKALASAFRTAASENEILFLDEVDSFLMSREGAIHSWESSGVNELLQQMEAFPGVLIAATNLADNLDAASLRRFTFKLQLDYLTDEGKRIFYARYFKSELSETEAKRLDRIDNLAPGDFRTVKERLFYVCENETNADRLSALEAEASAKHANGKIGF